MHQQQFWEDYLHVYYLVFEIGPLVVVPLLLKL
jgi:hypothetical protein